MSASTNRKYINRQNLHVVENYDNAYLYNNKYCKRVRVTKKKKKKQNIIVSFLALVLLCSWGYFVCPYMYENFLKPLYVNRILNSKINADISDFINPTLSYVNNSYLFDEPLLVDRNYTSKELTQIKVLKELTPTKEKLLELFKKYPNLQPSVFVWEYSSGAGIEIRADEIYPSASIIKIPIAFELMRKIQDSANTKLPVTLADKRTFSELYRTSGSGDLQKTRADVDYSLDYLAHIMIANSDNSATNMILEEIGGINGFNRAMRNLGLKVTSMGQWLPDLEGTNKITAREISTILYNINNPNFVSQKNKNILKGYLGSTRNTHLLKEKLPQDAMVLHKTGDIGEMLGDSGIVYTNKGKQYLVTILVKRPRNNYGAKLLIQDASLIIYNDINNL